MRELVDAEETFLKLDPIRKIREEPYEPDPTALAIGLGTDWSALASAWFTEWERHGPKAEDAEQKLLGTMRTIAAMPNGLVNGDARYNMETGEYRPAEASVSVSHLGAMHGLVEICAELIAAVDMPEFEEAWLPYCRFYNASGEEQEEEFGEPFGSSNLPQGHTRLDAYAYHRLGETEYADRAWDRFLHPDTNWEYAHDRDWSSQRNEDTLNPTDEASWVSTNTTALYGLAAIQNLALAGDRIPE